MVQSLCKHVAPRPSPCPSLLFRGGGTHERYLLRFVLPLAVLNAVLPLPGPLFVRGLGLFRPGELGCVASFPSPYQQRPCTSLACVLAHPAPDRGRFRGGCRCCRSKRSLVKNWFWFRTCEGLRMVSGTSALVPAPTTHAPAAPAASSWLLLPPSLGLTWPFPALPPYQPVPCPLGVPSPG